MKRSLKLTLTTAAAVTTLAMTLAAPMATAQSATGTGLGTFAPKTTHVIPRLNEVDSGQLGERLVPRCPSGFGLYQKTDMVFTCARNTSPFFLPQHEATAKAQPCNKIPNYKFYAIGPYIGISPDQTVIYWSCHT